MPIKYVGRESFFHGKSLYEIARNLRNLGVGRYVVRQAFKKYKEPSFYKLTSVSPEMNAKGYNRGTAYGHKFFRGVDYGVCRIDAGIKHDWVLIPKDQEEALLESVKTVKPLEKKQITASYPVPPLMEIIMRKEMTVDGYDVTDSKFYCKNKIKKVNKFNKAEWTGDTVKKLTLKKLTPAQS